MDGGPAEDWAEKQRFLSSWPAADKTRIAEGPLSKLPKPIITHTGLCNELGTHPGVYPAFAHMQIVSSIL